MGFSKMKRMARVGSLTVLGLALPALAQTPAPRRTNAPHSTGTKPEAEDASATGDDNDAPTGGGETEGTDATDNRPGQVKMGPPGANGKESAPGTVHTVVKGDTLWDLSQRYLGSPWYWPKVWSYNPKIANPHWIYPGNRVKFFSGGDDAPGEVESGDDKDADSGNEVADTGSNPDAISAESLLGEDNTVHVSGKISYQPKTAVKTIRQGFVTENELQDTGKIVGAFAENTLLSKPDLVYLEFHRRGDVKVGDQYVVYRTLSHVWHPITGRSMGYLTELTGMVKVFNVDGEMVRGRITEAWDDMARGDRIGPASESFHAAVEPKHAEHDAKGFVVTALEPTVTLMGERALVVVDAGRAEGLQTGNSVTFTRQGDPSTSLTNPLKSYDTRYPVEEIGECLAVDVKEHTTTCMIVRSLREIVPGDRFVMRAADVKVGVLTK